MHIGTLLSFSLLFDIEAVASLVPNSECFGLERRNVCELSPRHPIRPKERSNGFCATGDVMLGLCLFLACAVSAMERASHGDDRYNIYEKSAKCCSKCLCGLSSRYESHGYVWVIQNYVHDM